MDRQPAFAELDIWMRDLQRCGHGWGTAALIALSQYLRGTFGVRELMLLPSARNTRAIRSYEKAGFVRAEVSAIEQESRYGSGDYQDTVVMVHAATTDRY